MRSLSSSLADRRSYADAIPLAHKVLDLRQSVLGDEDPLTMNSTQWLGYLSNAAGDYAEAESWNQRAADLRKRGMGMQHPEYARVLNNLAFSYQFSGDYERAEPLFRQSAAIRRALFGESDPDTRATLKSLTEVLEHLAMKHQQAEDFGKARDERNEILSDKTKLYGNSDWRVTDARLALAHVERLGELSHDELRQLDDADASQATLPTLSAQGKYDDGISLAMESYKAHEKILGEETDTTAISAGWLGSLYDSSGDYGQAETWMKKRADIELRILGERHPNYGTAMEMLAELHWEMGNFGKAELLFQKALEIRESTLGKDRAYATTLNNFANLYDNMGDDDKARQLYAQSLDITRKLLGLKSSGYATSLTNLAMVQMKLGDYAEAEPLLRDAAEIHK